MPKLPYKLLVFVAVGAFFYLHGLPKRVQFVTQLLRNARNESREENLKVLVEEKIRSEICPITDLCEYRPVSWSGYLAEDSASVSIIHAFHTDGKRRTFLFRMRHGTLTEIINMY